MDFPRETPPEGAFFTLRELRALFPRLKSLEEDLNSGERALLIKIEKILYDHLSIREIEELELESMVPRSLV